MSPLDWTKKNKKQVYPHNQEEGSCSLLQNEVPGTVRQGACHRNGWQARDLHCLRLRSVL